LALRLYELQQRAVFDQPRRRGDDGGRRAHRRRFRSSSISRGYYYYPGELGPELSNYWEAHASVSYKLTDKITLAPTLAYAPNVWQTGAWGTYAAGTFSFDLPPNCFLPTWAGPCPSMSGAGCSVPPRAAAAVSAAGGGLPLPDFTNWHAGLTFTYRVFQARPQLHRHEPLERELLRADGDLGAIPGGVANPGNNPFGLRSGLCGATFSATLGFDINPATPGR